VSGSHDNTIHLWDAETNDAIVMALRAVLARSISAIDSEYKRVWQAIDTFIQIYMYLGELTLHGMA
jgi:hypothetical protein